MCVISEISQRAREYTHALLTAGVIDNAQCQAVMQQIQEQLALCSTAMMAEVRLRTNAVINERGAMEQISRELMTFIANRQEEKRRRRRAAFGKLREVRPPEFVEQFARPQFVVMESASRPFPVRYPDYQPEELAKFSH